MESPHQFEITDFKSASENMHFVKIGYYFAFVEDQRVLDSSLRIQGRHERLLLKKPDPVFPLLDEPLKLEGVTVHPNKREIGSIGCVTADRDLYRAEQDEVRLFTAFMSPPENLKLLIEYNGAYFDTLTPKLVNGVGIETLSSLLPGRYTAQLTAKGRKIGPPAVFTAAEYRLAPLSARLKEHSLITEETGEFICFTVAVESYQIPFEGELNALLSAEGHTGMPEKLTCIQPGIFEGKLPVPGKKSALRIRLTVEGDADRTAEIAIPGSRKRERDAFIISELGQEISFSMMPSPESIPVRGGHISRGERLPTPLVVEEILQDRRVLHTESDVESLTLLLLDLSTGNFSVQKVGDVEKGQEIEVQKSGSVCMVFAGCLVKGRPFEGYTTFIEPSVLSLKMEVPDRVRPRENISITLHCGGTERETPVLLSIRDQRLSASSNPETGLGASAKESMEDAAKEMDTAGIIPLNFLLRKQIPEPPLFAAAGGPDLREDMGFRDGTDEFILDLNLSDDYPDDPFLLDVEPSPFEELPQPESAAEAADTFSSPSGSPRITESPARMEFFQTLFYAIVSVSDKQTVNIPAGESFGTYSVEAFAMQDGDWVSERTSLVIDQAVRADLELPPAVHPDDRVRGCLRASALTGRAAVQLTLNGRPVPLHAEDGRDVLPSESVETPAVFNFDAGPGVYRAAVTDAASGETDSLEKTVAEPGRIKSYMKSVRMLRKGESISLENEKTLSLRILPGIDEPFDALVTAAAGYAHLCCEQTAAKILAAVFMYLTAKEAKAGKTAERIILAGIKREKKMFIPGKGFAMYPKKSHADTYWGPMAVRHLWSLEFLDQDPELPRSLRKAVRDGLAMADNAGDAYKMQALPAKVKSFEDAYALASSGNDEAKAMKFIRKNILFNETPPRLKKSNHIVSDRADMAYAAAALIALNEADAGLRLANQVTKDFNAQGSLYSTTDSAAAIALMVQLRQSGIVSGAYQVKINGDEKAYTGTEPFNEKIHSLEVLNGIVMTESTRMHQEDWMSFSGSFPVAVSFLNSDGSRKREFKSGDQTVLSIQLPGGYETGDVAHVSLPPALSWLEGGGQVKLFSRDFEGKDHMEIPLMVTGELPGRQHFAVCVRNMYKEERASCPGFHFIDPELDLHPFLGKWQVVSLDSQLDIDHRDSFMTIDKKNISHFCLGSIKGEMDFRIESYTGEERIEFTWSGETAFSQSSFGRGWGRVVSGRLFGMIYVHEGDAVGFEAEKKV